MRDDALTVRGPVHGTKDAKRVAIGSSVGAVIETCHFIGFGTAAALYFGHAFLSGASPIARTLASFATLGVRGNPDTLVNNARIITIKDLEPPASGIFSASCNSGGGPSPNLRAGLPSAADTTEPGPELLPGIDEATRHPGGRRGRRRSTDPEPSPQQRTTWTSAHDAKTSSTAADRVSLSGAIPDQPGAAMTSRSRHRAAQPGPRHTHTAAPPCAAAASPLTMASEYLVDNRSVPS